MKLKQAKVIISSAIAVFGMAGCANINTEDVEKHVEANKERIMQAAYIEDKTPDIVLFDKPYVEVITAEASQLPEWTFIPYEGTLKGTLENMVKLILRPLKLNIDYVDSVKKDKDADEFTISVGKGGTVLDAIKAISTASGYAYVIDDNKVSFQKFLTETFPIKHIAGETTVEFFEGTQTASSKNAHNAQYNVLKAIEKEIRAFLRLPVEDSEGGSGGGAAGAAMPMDPAMGGVEMGSTEMNMAEMMRQSQPERMARVDEGTSILTVKATPAEMVEVRKIIKEKNEYLSRQVFIEMEVLNVEFNDLNQSSVDFNLVRAFDDGAILGNLVTSAATSTIGAAFGTGTLTLTDGEGSGQGSQLLVEALEEQGQVTSEMLPAARVANNKRAFIKQTDNIYYIADRPSSSTNIAANSGVTQEELEVGFTMEVMPSIVGNEVTLKIKTTVKSLVNLETKGEGNQAVESPETRESEYYTDLILKSGETVVFTQLSEAFSSAKETKSGWGLFGFGDKLETNNSENLLMIKATIL